MPPESVPLVLADAYDLYFDAFYYGNDPSDIQTAGRRSQVHVDLAQLPIRHQEVMNMMNKHANAPTIFWNALHFLYIDLRHPEVPSTGCTALHKRRGHPLAENLPLATSGFQ
jgi:hypothetical protein